MTDALAPSPRSVTRLLQALAVLAMPAEAQGEHLAERDSSAHDLILGFSGSFLLLPQLVEAGWISADAVEPLVALARSLASITDDPVAARWSDGSVLTTPEWERARRHARDALVQVI